MQYRAVQVIVLYMLSFSLFAADFSNPMRVEIVGLPAATGGTPVSTEEAFITRDSWFDAFSWPGMINVIGDRDFVEDPAISHDGKVLYYHKHEANKSR